MKTPEFGGDPSPQLENEGYTSGVFASSPAGILAGSQITTASELAGRLESFEDA